MTLPSDLLENRTLFKTWLESQPPETVVGKTCSDSCCPLASYLAAQGVEKVNVQPSYVEYHDPDYMDGTDHYLLPPWSRAFIVQSDSIDTSGSVPVTAAEAIAILGSYHQA
jgi:hypothetical protein